MCQMREEERRKRKEGGLRGRFTAEGEDGFPRARE